MVFDFDDLWTPRLKLIILNLLEGELQHREIANAASHISVDYHGRFLVELLQNASDQAKQAGQVGSTVFVVRTTELLAVANQGMPFDDRGIRSITSLALSPKDASENLGNKGVGFKAVFEVSRSPEIYSSAAVGGSLVDGPINGFQLNQSALDLETIGVDLRGRVLKILGEEPTWDVRLRARPDLNDVVASVMAEVRRAPPWKFPIPLTRRDLEARLCGLGIIQESVSNTQTLIVLPLLPSEQVATVVDRAIDELLASDSSAVLFLPCVARIVVQDRTRRIDSMILRRVIVSGERVARGARLDVLETSVGPAHELEPRSALVRWWKITRTIGDTEGMGVENAERERKVIRAAAMSLPGEAWANVEKATISVALRQPDMSLPPGTPLGAAGRFCIGLPTKVCTGTPFWVDGHFHGNISRTEVNFELPYNSILFDEAVELIDSLIERLKADPELAVRRAVTLAFERIEGPVARRLWAEEGLAWRDVILAADGSSFVHARAIKLPARENMVMFNNLAAAVPDVAVFDFCLAEQDLMKMARTVLEGWHGSVEPSSRDDQRFLVRSPGLMSLLEYGGKHYRGSGMSFWETFLEWVLDHFSTELLRDQYILPVGDDELARPQDHVFLEPMQVADSGDAGDDDEVNFEGVSADVRRALRFLDGRAIQVRTGVRRDVTHLAARLAPLAGERLVHRPQLDEVINEVLAPRLQDISKDPERRELAVALLHQAITWIQSARPRTKNRIDRSGLRIPAVDPTGQWKWVPPTRVYFGSGWVDEEHEQLIEVAYGERTISRLVPWPEFSAAARVGEREWWINGMQLVGVMDAPRFLEPEGRRTAPLEARDYNFLSLTEAPCPIPGIERYWGRYLEQIRVRRVNYKSGQRYDVEDVCWVDGLEEEQSRPAIVTLMLRHPEYYEGRVRTRLGRVDGRVDSTPVPTLWVDALWTNRWSVVPAECDVDEKTRTIPPSEAWWLSPDQRRKVSSKLLQRVPSRFERAANLLLAIGVNTWESIPVGRLIAEVHRLAILTSAETTRRSRAALVLANELYERLQEHCLEASQAGQLLDMSQLLAHPVPLLRGKRLMPAELTAVELTKLERLYIDDDPVRASFIRDYDQAYRLPLRDAQHHFVSALRALIGGERVVRTSEALVGTGFIATPGSPPIPLLEFLHLHFVDAPVEVDLGLILAYGGSRTADPSKEDFREDWRRFKRVLVQFGSFSARSSIDGAQISAFYDHLDATLQVAETLNHYEVIEASWPVAGATYRDLWSAYVRALAADQRERFFAERRIGPAQRAEVEVAIGGEPSTHYLHLVTALFAIWRREHRDRPLREFEVGWAPQARIANQLADWLGSSRINQVLEGACDLGEEEGCLALLSAAGLTVRAWQLARREMGIAPWQFTASRQRYEEAREQLAAGLMSFAARSPGVDLNIVQGVIASLQTSDAPPELLEEPVDYLVALGAAVHLADKLLAAIEDQGPIETLVASLQALSRVPPSELHARVNELGTQREVVVYRRDPEGLRTVQAREVVENVLRVAVPLSQAKDEKFDREDVLASPLVAMLSAGWWANRWAVLAALQRTLTTVAPATAKALSEQRAFRECIPWRELWAKFPELGQLPSPALPLAPLRQVSIFGQALAEDLFKQKFCQGTTGEIGKLLERFVSEDLDLGGLRPVNRGLAMPRKPTGKKGSGGGGGRRTGEVRWDREVNGLLGEAFVYEQFRRILPDFDEFAWVSENRVRYGLADTGDDSLGYDFQCRDISGKLTGRANCPQCWIEVKATSGEGSNPFFMSVGEWERAHECHTSGSQLVYVIVRVADVRDIPRLTDIIVDPVDYLKKKWLHIKAQDLLVTVGFPSDVEQGSEEGGPLPPE